MLFVLIPLFITILLMLFNNSINKFISYSLLLVLSINFSLKPNIEPVDSLYQNSYNSSNLLLAHIAALNAPIEVPTNPSIFIWQSKNAL